MKSVFILFTFLCTPFYLFAQGANDDWTFHQQPGDGWFGGIVEDSNGRIIIGGGSPNSHFRVLEDTTWTLHHPDDYGVNFVFLGRDVDVDLDNNVWLSPGNHDGITKWNGTSLENFNTSNSDIVSNSNFGIAIDQNNHLFTTSWQSFDGSNWQYYGHDDCYKGGARNVFVADNNDIWISGTPSIGIETGTVTQPCVHRISNGIISSFHFENGDNLPKVGRFFRIPFDPTTF